MSEYLPFLVIGVTTGSLYGLAGIGLVLTYRTSGIFNFAHGALAAAAAYLFYSLHVTAGWPWPVAMLASMTTFGLVAGVVMEWLARSLVGARIANIIVATVGLYLFTQGALVKIYGPARRNMSQFLATGQPFEIASVPISWADLINLGVGVGVFVAVFVFLRSTRPGLAMQAVVADRSLLALAGTDPVRVSRLSWIFGCTMAALTGILLAPTLGLDTVLLSALVVQAFGAVAIGRFVSLPLTYAGGLIVGVLAQLASKEYASNPPWDGLPGSVPFIILILVMLISQSRRLPVGAGRASGRASTRSRRSPGRSRLGVAVGLGALVLIPETVGARLPVYHAALIFALLFLSLGLLTGLSGQISLAHAAFAGVGAATFSHVAVDSGVPWLASLVIAGGAAALIGIVLALPAMRLSGLYLALATYGFALMMDLVIFRTGPLFGEAFSGLPGTRPELGGLISRDDRDYYYVTLVVVVVCAAAILALSRTRLGLYLRGMSESSTALNTLGLNVNITRVIVFATSAFFAGVAGALYIGQIGRLSALSFNAAYSLLYLAVFVVASALPGLLVPAFVAAGLLVVLPSYISSVTLEVQSMLFGGSAVVMAVLADRTATWAALRSRLDTWVEATVASGERRTRSGPIRARTALARASTGGQP